MRRRVEELERELRVSARAEQEARRQHDALREQDGKLRRIAEKAVTRQRREYHRMRDSMLRLLSARPAIWFFTQKKSGTTYVLHVLLNYLHQLAHRTDTQIDHRVLATFHTMEELVFDPGLADTLALQRSLLEPSSPYEALVHTHVPIAGATFRKTVCLTRNPLDSAVSNYFFHVVNRGKTDRFDEVLPARLREFVKTTQAQTAALEQAGPNGRLLHYESLMREPERTLRDLLTFLDLPVDADRLRVAMDHASVDGLRRLEASKGAAVVAPDDYRAPSFVRSGKIGEWRDYFDAPMVDTVRRELAAHGIDLDGFVLE